jgi:lysozyme
MILRNILFGLTLGGVGYYVWAAMNEPLINDGGGGGVFEAITTDLQGGFMSVSNTTNLNMGVSIALLGYLKGWEKYSAIPYYATPYEKAAGKQTIGYGHVIKPLENLTFLSEQEATNLLLQDVASAENSINTQCQQPLTQNQFDALVSLAFNAGNKAATKVIADINAGNWANVPNHISLYHFQGKTSLNGLINRRNKDIAIWNSAIYAS